MAFPATTPNNLPDPTAANTLFTGQHSLLHQSHNAEIAAIEAKVGTGASTPASNTLLIGTGTGTSSWSAITSAQLAARISDETGSGAAVFGTSPTLATPAITSPKITTAITDANGNEIIRTPATGSAVNDITVTNAATGAAPVISATGDDTNIGLTLTPKGTGGIVLTNRYDGWVTGLTAPTTVTALGNRSYSLVYASSIAAFKSAGMRGRTTRTVAAPTQCTSLNGTTQYYSKLSPNKSTFTNNFVVFAAVKPSSYVLGTIASVYNGTSGWALRQLATGQIELAGYNAGAANFFKFTSNYSVPLNKWTNNVIAQIDMTVTTNTATTNYIMIDGVDIPGVATRGGTNPVALVQAGNLNIGAENGGTNPYAGKIAQAGWFTAKVTQATMLSYFSQGLAGTETNLGSAYSFNNVITDLNTTTPNDLTANGSALATNADSPFGGQADGTNSSTLDYYITTKVSSDGLTETVQVPEGCTIPTSGGVAAVAYSVPKVPYGMPIQKDKWTVLAQISTTIQHTAGAASTWYNIGSFSLTLPIGAWNIQANLTYQFNPAGAAVDGRVALSTSSSAYSDIELIDAFFQNGLGAGSNNVNTYKVQKAVSVNAQTPYYALFLSKVALSTNPYINGDLTSTGPTLNRISAECAYL